MARAQVPVAHCNAVEQVAVVSTDDSTQELEARASHQPSSLAVDDHPLPERFRCSRELSTTKEVVVLVSAGQCQEPTGDCSGSRKPQSTLRIATVSCATALVCAMAFLALVSSPARSTERTELVWNPLALEDSISEDHDLWGGRDKINRLLRMQATEKATEVSHNAQDDDRMGLVLARATHVAFDTVVEIKRAMRGMRGREEDLTFDSKIEVVETMLSHLLEKLGISSVPKPPETTRQASLANAIEMARALRLMLSNLPSGNDATDYRQARYNLAVYDLDQVSRQLNEIMLMLSAQRQLFGLREPAHTAFDVVLHDSDEGLRAAEAAYGVGGEHQAAWRTSEEEARWNLLPRWKRELERYKDEGAADKEMQEEDEEEGEPEEEDDEGPEEEEEPEEEAPHEGEDGEENAEASPSSVPERLVQEAVSSAVEQGAIAEAESPHAAASQRRVESAAVSSAIHQLQRTRTGAPAPALHAASRPTQLLQEGSDHVGGHVGQMLLETRGGGVLSWVRGGGRGARARSDQERYALELAKDAVYAAAKKGMEMELSHPAWHTAVENSASVAVDAAIRADTGLLGGPVAVERAAVEGATKAAEEEVMAAHGDHVKGKTRQEIAQRVENAAVRAAILASNGVNLATPLRIASPRPLKPLPVVPRPVVHPADPSTVVTESAVPAARPVQYGAVPRVQYGAVPSVVPAGMRIVQPVSVSSNVRAFPIAAAPAPIRTPATAYTFPFSSVGAPGSASVTVGSGASPVIVASSPPEEGGGPTPVEAVRGAAAAAEAADKQRGGGGEVEVENPPTEGGTEDIGGVEVTTEGGAGEAGGPSEEGVEGQGATDAEGSAGGGKDDDYMDEGEGAGRRMTGAEAVSRGANGEGETGEMFVPDSTQSLAGMVSGNMYVPTKTKA